MDELIRVEEVPLVRGVDDFDTFFRSEYRSVLGLAIVLSGSRSAAEEITQDAFLATYRSWERVGRLDRPEAWVRRVVANRSVSRFRRMTAEAKALTRIGRRETDTPDVAATIDVDLWRQVRTLPKRQAQVIALTYLHDLPRREVAEILGCSTETVKTHLERAKTTLASRMGTDGKDSHGH